MRKKACTEDQVNRKGTGLNAYSVYEHGIENSVASTGLI